MVTFFMSFLNVEIKAVCHDLAIPRQILIDAGADFTGIDLQTDTYFNVANGRLKLRQGNIENFLIYYEREGKSGPKNSHFHLIPVIDPVKLKEALSKACGIKVVVRKKREIYFLGNVKILLDEIEDLGTFVEIEAGNLKASKTQGELEKQCGKYMELLKIKSEDLISGSYSDLILKES